MFCWCFVLLPNQCGTSQSTPFGAQRPRWRSFLPPIDVGLSPNPPPSGPSVLADTSPCCHIVRCLVLIPFVTTQAGRSFLPPINVGPPPNPSPSGPSVLTGILPRVYPLQGTTRRLTHCPVSGFDTIYNDQGPPLADIVLSGLSLPDFS